MVSVKQEGKTSVSTAVHGQWTTPRRWNHYQGTFLLWISWGHF